MTKHKKITFPLQNGLVALVTTLSFFSMTHMTIILELKKVVDDEIGAVIALSILLNFYILWIIFDLIVMGNAMRFVFSPQASGNHKVWGSGTKCLGRVFFVCVSV